MLMPFVTGLVLSFGVMVFARRTGFDRDRAFYPTVVIVVASYYVLFAAIGATRDVLLAEILIMAAFCVAAVFGFKSSAWFAVLGLIGHGVLDSFHGRLIANAGVPDWWPAFCGAYDVGAGVGLAWLLKRPTTSVGMRS